MKNQLFVTKASGAQEPFAIEKLRNSLSRSKATSEEINSIINELAPVLYPGISTKKIYTEAFRLLRHHSKSNAARYYLKRGIMELGPSGFPFEKYIGELFKHQGYSVHIDQTLQGKCVTHEIDVVAEKGNEMLLMECKYRNLSGITVDVKTPLYIQARFEDILANGFDRKKNFKGWIVTNSGFTTDALKYGNCKGLEMMSWAYPKNKGLKDMIDNTGLYPVTCLTSLTHREKQLLLENNYVLVSDINSNSQLLQLAGVKETRYKNVIDECSRLCQAQ